MKMQLPRPVDAAESRPVPQLHSHYCHRKAHRQVLGDPSATVATLTGHSAE